MQASPSTGRPAAPSSIDASAFDHLTDTTFVCKEWEHRDRVIIILSEDGRLSWDFVPQEAHGLTVDEVNGASLTWTLPTNLRAGPLRGFISDHLWLLERVHRGHTVHWDGLDRVGELDEDAQAASRAFRVALEGYADDPDHVIWPADPAVWFEDSSAQFVGLEDDELEAAVRHSINSGKPFQVNWTWVVVDLDKARAYAWKVRDHAAGLAGE